MLIFLVFNGDDSWKTPTDTDEIQKYTRKGRSQTQVRHGGKQVKEEGETVKQANASPEYHLAYVKFLMLMC